MELSGMIHLLIEVGGIKTWLKLYIVPDLDWTIISGEDSLKKNRAQMNFNPNQLKLKGVKIKLVVSLIFTH